MILDRLTDSKGAYYLLGALQRAELEFENYASSDASNRFYSEDYLKGICERRNEIYHRTEKTIKVLIFTATIIAFFDSIQGTTNIGGLTISISNTMASAICVFMAFNFLNLLFCMTDQLLIDKYINALGNRLGYFSFHLLLMNHSAQNLWVRSAMPFYFGLQSDNAHNRVQWLFLVFAILVATLAVIFPVSVYITSVIRAFEGGISNIEIVLFSVSGTLMLLTLILGIALSLRYKFRPSGLPEPPKVDLPENFLELGYPARERRDATEEPQAHPLSSNP